MRVTEGKEMYFLLSLISLQIILHGKKPLEGWKGDCWLFVEWLSIKIDDICVCVPLCLNLNVFALLLRFQYSHVYS